MEKLIRSILANLGVRHTVAFVRKMCLNNIKFRYDDAGQGPSGSSDRDAAGAENEVHTATVNLISPRVDENGMVRIEAELSDCRNLDPGMTAFVNL